jgi:hypothetical protein
MRVIAFMTMTFLPGTFFAAIFAMPLLQWNEPHVVHPRFWVYWIFTVPSTLLVFAISWVITKYSSRMKQSDKSWHLNEETIWRLRRGVRRRWYRLNQWLARKTQRCRNV